MTLWHFPIALTARKAKPLYLLLSLTISFASIGNQTVVALDANQKKLNEIETLITAKKYDQALLSVNNELKTSPKDPKLLVVRGRIYGWSKDYQKALSDGEAAIKLDPTYAKAYDLRGAAYAYLGQYQKCIDDANKAIQLDPKDIKAYVNRGSSYYRLKRFNESLVDCNKALQMNPSNHIPYEIRGLVMDAWGSSKKS